MADLGDLKLKIEMVGDKAVISGLEGIGAAVDTTSKKAKGGGLLDFMGKLGLAGMALQQGAGLITQYVAPLMNLAGSLEQNRIAFTTMTGSAENADKILQKVADFAAATPFEMPELVGSTKNLIAFGMTGDVAFETMKKLGDVAAGTGTDIGGLSFIIGQMNAKGKADTEDLNQLANRGVPIWTTLAETMGKTPAEIRKLVETGKIGLPQVQGAIDKMTGSGGRFFGMMENQSKSFTGMMSTLKDNLTTVAMKALGVDMTGKIDEDGIFAQMKRGLEDVLKFLNENMDAIQTLATVIIKLGKAVFAPFVAISKLFQLIFDSIFLAGELIQTFFDSLWENVTSIFNLIKKVISGDIKGALSDFYKESGQTGAKAFEQLKNVAMTIGDDVIQFATAGQKNLDDVMTAVGVKAKDTGKEVVKAVDETVKEINKKVPLTTEQKLAQKIKGAMTPTGTIALRNLGRGGVTGYSEELYSRAEEDLGYEPVSINIDKIKEEIKAAQDEVMSNFMTLTAPVQDFLKSIPFDIKNIEKYAMNMLNSITQKLGDVLISVGFQAIGALIGGGWGSVGSFTGAIASAFGIKKQMAGGGGASGGSSLRPMGNTIFNIGNVFGTTNESVNNLVTQLQYATTLRGARG